MSIPIFEFFLRPDSASMIEGEIQLTSKGKDALPDLEAFFSGTARNDYGVPYCTLGQAMRCTLKAIRRLGNIAKPLEHYLRAELNRGNFVAAQALGSLGSLDESSILDLAKSLGANDKSVDLPFEAAAALIICGQENHPATLAACVSSERAKKTLLMAKDYLARKKV